MHAKAGESDRAIRVKKVLIPTHTRCLQTPDVVLCSQNTCLLASGRRARRADGDSPDLIFGVFVVCFLANSRDDIFIDALAILMHELKQPQTHVCLQVLQHLVDQPRPGKWPMMST